MSVERKLLGKVIISGKLECLTGLHVGASKENMEIGAIDSPVVRDPITREPYIPGSSLKGKLRAMLEKANPLLLSDRDGGSGIKRHECDTWNIENKDTLTGAINCPVCRIFGSTGKGEKGKNFPARLIVRDLNLTNYSRDKLADIDTGLQYTEWKFENAIDRVTSAANPRQIERVPRGAEFDFELIYNVEEPQQMIEDLKNLRLAIKLVEMDALGGHGSRGYGKVKFNIVKIEGKTVVGYKDETITSTSKVITSLEQLSGLESLFNPATTAKEPSTDTQLS